MTDEPEVQTMADEQERCTQCEESALCLRRQLAQAQERAKKAERSVKILETSIESAEHVRRREQMEHLAREAQMRRVLEAVEWVERELSTGHLSDFVCPCCNSTNEDGHAPECELAAVLTGAQGDGKGSTNPLAAFTEGQLMDELGRRGFVAVKWAREEDQE